MKLRNKRTGEIKDVCEVLDMKQEDGILYKYYSLAELNSEWEDVPEEPIGYWFVNSSGGIDFIALEDDSIEGIDGSKQIGNYFSSREEAELALKKLKAFKRLKDGGFEFIELRAPNYGSSDFMNIKARCPWTSKNIDDLRICFGGEE